MASATSSPSFSRYQLPGLNLPLNWTPHEPYKTFATAHNPSTDVYETTTTDFPAQGEGKNLFRTALNEADCKDGYVSLPLTTLREFTMLHIMNSLTDKPGWETKIFDKTITKKWKVEILATPGRDVSQKMVDWVIAELRFKARIFQKTSAIVVYNGDVVKSDTVISENIRQSLKDAVRSLEDVPGIYKDYHPGSDGKVLDLVHPSLFPLIYGKTRVLEDCTIGLQDCVQTCGKGVIVPIRPDEECRLDRKGSMQYNSWRIHEDDSTPYSKKFQWLPSEVEFTKEGKAKFTSYINNLHPQTNQGLYSVIEQIIDLAIPLWNMTLTPLQEMYWKTTRITYEAEEENPEEGPQQEDYENIDDFYQERDEWLRSEDRVIQPEPGHFGPLNASDQLVIDYFESPNTHLEAKIAENFAYRRPYQDIDLKRDYEHRGLQIIVKLANIELSPERPQYEGGTWHVEGQLNEHICATALYYYDSENISESRLAFRQQSSDDTMDIGYGQDHHAFLMKVFGCEQNSPRVQEIGSVLCKEGRLLTFPNILQHRVQPFKLADPTQPGHRKILALFLVDPGIRIISTANVPPQQRDWWSESVIKDFANTGKALGKLSNELKDKIFDGVSDFPISIDEAKEIRLKLMEERKNFVVRNVKEFEAQEFSLCEH